MKKYIIIIIMVIALVLQGCTQKDEDNAKEENSDAAAVNMTLDVQSDSGQTTSAPAATPTTVATATQPPQLVLPVTTNETGKVLIQTVSASPTYKTTSFIITSAEGEIVVVDPTSMPKKDVIDVNPAAIVSTHSHPDHTDAVYNKEYEQTAQMILYTEGDINTKDFHIYTVTSSHMGDTINGTNDIMIFEVDGLRIAHMGDVGQTSLTEEQLKAIGNIDIAFMQFENSYSDMTVDNMKGFTIIEQVNPKIVIPTHYSVKSRALMEEKYGTITVVENLFEISQDELPDTTMNVYELTNTHKYR